MKNKDNSNRCAQCTKSCCKYFTVKIETPRSKLDFDNLLWKMYHKNVKIFNDRDGWFLLIDNPCVHLSRSGKCTIYSNRPIVCRRHSNLDCEFTRKDDKGVLHFKDYLALDKYCRKRFKNWKKRYDDEKSG
ncbi:MAG: YkgJ family cysteine cluster protein [Spirochaetales bacterium]|nr:YkgJ family cysteine cluster protein [Spirochaetales bacterium]